MLCFCFPLLPRVVPLSPSFIPSPPLPKAAKLSCCAACVFDLVFHWLSSCQGQGLRLGPGQSYRVWLGVTQLLQSCAALNHSPPAESGSASDSSLPHIWLGGAPDSSHHWPNRLPHSLPLSANFLIYACKLYIFSSVKAGTQSLLGVHFLCSWCWVFCAWAQCPQVAQLFPSKWARETEIRGVL